jgi:hypothetical protein
MRSSIVPCATSFTTQTLLALAGQLDPFELAFDQFVFDQTARTKPQIV